MYKMWSNFPFESFSGEHGLACQKTWDAKLDLRLKPKMWIRTKHSVRVYFHSFVFHRKFPNIQLTKRKNGKNLKKFCISCLAPLLIASKPDCPTLKDWKQTMPQGKIYPGTDMLLLVFLKDTGVNHCSTWEYLGIWCEYKCLYKSSSLFSYKFSLQNCATTNKMLLLLCSAWILTQWQKLQEE